MYKLPRWLNLKKHSLLILDIFIAVWAWTFTFSTLWKFFNHETVATYPIISVVNIIGFSVATSVWVQVRTLPKVFRLSKYQFRQEFAVTPMRVEELFKTQLFWPTIAGFQLGVFAIPHIILFIHELEETWVPLIHILFLLSFWWLVPFFVITESVIALCRRIDSNLSAYFSVVVFNTLFKFGVPFVTIILAWIMVLITHKPLLRLGLIRLGASEPSFLVIVFFVAFYISALYFVATTLRHEYRKAIDEYYNFESSFNSCE